MDTEEEETTMIAMELRDLRAAAEDTRGSSPTCAALLGCCRLTECFRLRLELLSHFKDAMRIHARSCEHFHSSLCALPVCVCACFC